MMRVRYGAVALLFLCLCGSAVPAAAQSPAQVPQLQDDPVFEVRLTDRTGTPRDTFSLLNPPFLDIRFVLALSASDRYHTTITAIDQAGVETVLFKGQLEKGFYRFSPPLPLPGETGQAVIRLILKPRFFAKKFTGQSFYVYRHWEGAYRMD
jgi:hypothetical protein